MCGIVAILSESHPIEVEDLTRAMGRLRHRGPDDAHHWIDGSGRVALGHTRLSIIDLETGRQPLTNEDGTLHLVVNGEFYDYERLRQGLSARGHTLRTRSDSEVALHLYEEMGMDFLRLMRGEFAFVMWDGRKKTLYAVRDRFGVKPLFYAQHGGRLIVASEIKALLGAGLPAAWDHEGMFQALHFSTHQDRALFEGVRQVPPGHYLEFRGGRARTVRYWDADYPRGPLPEVDEAECAYEMSRLLEESIRIRTRADVPLACYLSGGVDSSSVLGMAKRLTDKEVAAFTIAFDHPDFDESELAEEMAAMAGSPCHTIRVTDQDFADHFEISVAQGEMVLYNGHGPARFILSRAVQQAGYKVALGGEGADELFVGYHFAQSALKNSQPNRWAGLGVARRLIRARTDTERFVHEVSPLLAWVSRGLGFPPELLDTLAEKFTFLRGLMAPDFLRAFERRDPYREFMSQFRVREALLGREPVKVVLYLWMKSAFPNYVLAAERLDMAHGVEVRLPFLDHKVFEYARTLPADLLFKNGRNKHLLRQVAKPFVTKRVHDGPKKPFFAPPSARRLNNPLTALAQDLIRSKDFERVPFFDHRAVHRFLDGLDAMPDALRASLDPVIFLLASVAVLQRHYQMGSSL